MIMNKGVLELKDIKIFARHGCFEEEREIGNWFIVDGAYVEPEEGGQENRDKMKPTSQILIYERD